ncbi:hypothetical protein HO173_005928 [Letharia columbiana]|uniref:Mnd1 HTH domain-containing protein n=1 Tax=Letharia columbiana TaxID=112416 RepID=A0A8H6FVZ2_9LECA|nr:uncharacterized protein HO173_005928 [Letharia columbiana]KAF6235733.1 hypothetical protein HO173_005928 [Letharia columbiana]
MAPKTLPPIAKQNLILTYLHNSRTAHSIKELEKALPSVASINGMQVKDYLQALSDEGKIRVEKIGSGNWYWSFLSEEKKSRDNVLGMLKEELAKVEASLGELEEKLREASEKRGRMMRVGGISQCKAGVGRGGWSIEERIGGLQGW